MNAADPSGHHPPMHASRTIVALGIALCALSGAPRAHAQTPERLTVQVDPGLVDPEALERALARDLGVEVVITTEEASGSATLRVALSAEGAVRLELTREGRAPLARELEAPVDLEERTVIVALIAANLVRDESLEILAMLRVPQADDAEPDVSEADPSIEAPVEEPLAEVPAAIDLAPGAGMSSGFLGRDRRYFSLGLAGAWMGELRGLALSGAVDLVLGEASGAQIAGALALAERVAGLQLGGAVALGLSRAHGVQIGALTLSGGEVLGLQLGAVGVAFGRLAGAQVGAVGVAGEGAEGLQLGAVMISGGALRGAQISAVNVAGASLEGLQVGGVNVAGGRVAGAQVSAVNVGVGVSGVQVGPVNVSGAGMAGVQVGGVNVASGDAEGVQLGAVNVATGRVRGVQIGAVNIAEDADAGVGLVSIYARGRTQLRAGADTTGLLSASVVHGARITHSVVAISTQPFQGRPAFLAGAGFGARATFEEGLHLDVDALAHIVLDDQTSNDGPGLLAELRVVFGARVLDVFGLYAGLSYQLHVRRSPIEGGLGGPLLETAFSSDVHGWPAILGGIELF